MAPWRRTCGLGQRGRTSDRNSAPEEAARGSGEAVRAFRRGGPISADLDKELSLLASKLCTTAEHLWQVLIRQAYIDSLSSLCSVLVCIALALGTVYAFFYLRRRYNNLNPDQRWMYPPPPADQVLLFFVLLLIVTTASTNFYWVVSDFFNPEFYAFRRLPGAR